MEPNIFSPRIQQFKKDSLGQSLFTLAKIILVFVFGLLPVFFVPQVFTALGLSKIYFVVIGLFIAFILLSLSVLREGKMRLVAPLALGLFWAFTIFSLAAGLLSGDKADSLYGNFIEVNTASFFLVMALVMTISLAFSDAKNSILRLFIVLGMSALALQTFHVLRLFFGPEFLSFGIFTAPTVSLIGSFNDLAIFSGLVIIVTLIVLQQLVVSRFQHTLATLLIVLSLILLSVINFYIVWLIVGFVGLLMTLYLVSKDTWLKSTDSDNLPVSRFTLGLVGFVCIFSGAFIISSDFLGATISKFVDISYLEVRPSVGATLDVAKSVLSKNAFFGTGPNQFEVAWREHKDPIINQTVFWNTDFTSGSGFVPTLFVTTGITGGVLFSLFLLMFVYLGYRTLFTAKFSESSWYLIGTISFFSAVYLWSMAILYVPGIVIMLLAAIMTGVSFAVYTTVVPTKGIFIDVTSNKKYGLVLIAAVLVVIISSTLSVIKVSKLYLANVVYADTILLFQSGGDLSMVDEKLSRAQNLFDSDVFLAERAQLRFIQLNQMSAADPATVDRQKFDAALVEGINLAERALSLDRNNPVNYILLSNFYGLLDPNQFEGIREKTEGLLNQARDLDPTNPYYLLSLAQYQVRINDLEGARSRLLEAINAKSDFTEALFLLAQIDIQEGKTESAIEVTRAMISIEPNNPTRYFQLGFLLATINNLNESNKAFEVAVQLDPNYANAQYFLALNYLDQNRVDEALKLLNEVRKNNPDNEAVISLISQAESGSYQRKQSDIGISVQNNADVSQEEGVTTSSQLPDTDLVTPLNRSSSLKEERKDDTVSSEANTESTSDVDKEEIAPQI